MVGLMSPPVYHITTSAKYCRPNQNISMYNNVEKVGKSLQYFSPPGAISIKQFMKLPFKLSFRTEYLKCLMESLHVS